MVKAIEPVLTSIGDWTIRHVGWSAVSSGLQRVYKAGCAALSASSTNPSVANLHEWRKQAKYLWHGQQLIGQSWTDEAKELGDRAHRLTQLLGDDHDLAVLRQMLGADPLAYGGCGFLENLFLLIKRRRENLEQQAFAIGRCVYRDSPTTFTKRMEQSRKW